MKTRDIINLDCREYENKRKIQMALRKIKPFSKIDMEKEVSLDKLEKILRLLCNKYKISIWVAMDLDSADDSIIWHYEIINEYDHKVLFNVYGLSCYDAISKSVIALYGYTRKVKS